MVRMLRMMFSAVCGTVCLLLLVLWMRSYCCEDQIRGPLSASKSLRLQSEEGWLRVSFARPSPSTARWSFESQSIEAREQNERQFIATGGTVVRRPYRLGWHALRRGGFLETPHWLALLVIWTLSVIPWLPRRFGLRALLGAMAVIAAALGAIVWSMR